MSSGLVISRLGVQATASDDLVHGLICLRISLPKENESNHSMRWNLFSGPHPRLLSEPTIHPLPLPLSLPNSSGPRTSRPRALAIASTLLNLSTPPDSPRTQGGPHLHISPNGGVSVVLDPYKGKRRSTQATQGRSDWVVILEFEAPVEQGGDRHFRKVLLPLPKCLHSIIRFQISPPTSGPSREGEVSILTEPKMLALPISTFSSPPLPFPRIIEATGYEDGWEDGEDGMSEMSDMEDDGSWLEGRFQATSQLRLEWSFMNTSSATTLNITPSWERQEIGFNYESNPSSASALVPIELVIPTGWGWSHLDIQGSSLRSFRSTDVIAWHTTIHRSEEEEEEEEESFSTIRRNIIPPTLRPNTNTNTNTSLSASRSSSLMKQSLPTGEIDEFSFENQDDSHTTIIPPSPIEERRVIIPDKPTAARLFDLIFDDDSEDRSFTIDAVLVPLFPTLISGAIPIQIPFVRSGDCRVTCPNSTLVDSEVDTSGLSIGEFTWIDMYGSTIPSSSVPIKGAVRVRLMRDTWSVRMGVMYTSTTGEVAFSLGKGVRIRKAEVDGVPIRYCLTERGEGTEVRLNSDVVGVTDVELDLGEGDISLPHFESAEGTMIVEFRGSGWDSLISSPIPGLTPHPTLAQTYITTFPTPPIHLNLNPSTKRKTAKTLFSFSTFFNLLLLWLVVSLGQQVQRLRSEMVFVVEEARDLRMYHTPPPLPPLRPPSTAGEILPDGIDLKELLERLRLEQTTSSPSSLVTNHSLGRVVFNQWEWVNHPAFRTVTSGVAKIWDVVLWLLHG